MLGRSWGWLQGKRGIVLGVAYWAGRPASLDKGFVGRENDLKAIKEAFKEHQSAVLAGGAGSGKSRLAAEYTYKSKARGFWTPAADSAEASVAALAPFLNVKTENRTEEEISIDVQAQLNELPAKTLWVVDNLSSLNQFNALRDAAGAVRLLITTRAARRELLPETAAFLPVEKLDPAGAVELLARKGNQDRSDRRLPEIAKAVDYLPYALEMVAVRMKEHLRSSESVLAELEAAPNRAQFAAFRNSDYVDEDRPTLFQAISGALQALPDEARIRLAPFGYLADAPVPLPLAQALADRDDSDFPAFVRDCARQSVFTATEENVSIHALTTAANRRHQSGRRH